jgi:hypothetical protein
LCGADRQDGLDRDRDRAERPIREEERRGKRREGKGRVGRMD